MKYLILALAMAASASAQGKNGTDECYCALGAAHGHDHQVTEIYEMKAEWDHGCDQFAEKVCQEECDVRLEQLEELGGWRAPAGKNLTVGNAACEKIGKDVKDLHSVVIYSICKHDLHVSERAFKYPLCCEDKKEVKC